MINFYQLIPEIFILALILITLCFGLLNKDRSIAINTIGFFILTLILINFGKDFYISTDLSLNTINLFVLSKIILSIGSIVFILLSKRPLKNENMYRYEYILFILFAILGSFVLISSDNFLTAFIGLELQSLSLYLMAAFNTKNLKSNEAGIKYFSLGALSSGFLLFGISMIYYDTGSFYMQNLNNFTTISEIGLSLVLISLFFKVSAAPFHIWTPDVYEGSPTISTLFFASLPKFASLIFLFRVYQELNISGIQSLNYIFQIVCAISLLVGVYGAITQKVIKRLLAFSSINHIGFMLLGIMSYQFMSEGTLFFYLIIYLITTFGIFAVLLNLRTVEGEFTKISQLNGLRFTSNSKSISMLVFFFSLAGIPPFAGFFAKFFILSASITDGFFFLSTVAVLSSVIAAFYYLTIIKNMFFNKSEIELLDDNNKIGKVIFTSFGLIITLFFFYPDPLINLVDNLFK
ncbi:NADH-quinone oxidoreductase subunit N [Alphaproteobacteria bacterium]|nr:NADH-quinone oxidoreductase subunit N [Alphaproteobacteria bacterium]